MKTDKKRIEILDELRGFAILAMIVHHTFYDIGFVMGIDWGYKVFDALCNLQPIFWTLFIVISGICSQLSRNTIKRGLIVLLGGLVVTVVTAVIMPAMGIVGAEIYFGILTCLGICMIITGLLRVPLMRINSKIGMAICAVLFCLTYSISTGSLLFGIIDLPDALYTTNWLVPFGIFNDNFYSADYFSLIPWIFMFIFGAFVGRYAKQNQFPQWTYKKRSPALALIGKNSLWVYLAHQPVIYAFCFVATLIINR